MLPARRALRQAFTENGAVEWDGAPPEATGVQLARVHTAAYLAQLGEALAAATDERRVRFDGDTATGPLGRFFQVS